MKRKHLAAAIGAALFSAAGAWAQTDAPYGSLDLTDGQRHRIAAIQEEGWNRHWDLVRALYALTGNAPGAAATEADIRNGREAMELVRGQIAETRLAMQQDIEALLTEEQKEQWRQDSGEDW